MVEQYLVTLWIILSWLLLALQVKVGKVASFACKTFVHGQTFNHENQLPHENYQLYSRLVNDIIYDYILADILKQLFIVSPGYF